MNPWQNLYKLQRIWKGLQSEDIANAILYAIQAPNHVNVNEILIRPTSQER
jgi:NADP-dependent 3-hydroxy acid dehydrogenase YdfG